jgi:hypothetical protein
MKDQVDYSLYLVTDSTEAILGSKDLVQVVEQALSGGWFFFPSYSRSFLFRRHRNRSHHVEQFQNND